MGSSSKIYLFSDGQNITSPLFLLAAFKTNAVEITISQYQKGSNRLEHFPRHEKTLGDSRTETAVRQFLSIKLIYCKYEVFEGVSRQLVMSYSDGGNDPRPLRWVIVTSRHSKAANARDLYSRNRHRTARI
jgi:hypothetical protein